MLEDLKDDNAATNPTRDWSCDFWRKKPPPGKVLCEQIMRTHELYDRLCQPVSTTVLRLVDINHAVKVDGADNIRIREYQGSPIDVMKKLWKEEYCEPTIYKR